MNAQSKIAFYVSIPLSQALLGAIAPTSEVCRSKRIHSVLSMARNGLDHSCRQVTKDEPIRVTNA